MIALTRPLIFAREQLPGRCGCPRHTWLDAIDELHGVCELVPEEIGDGRRIRRIGVPVVFA
jgi:hypothetical protein